jgi:hypothetical protein
MTKTTQVIKLKINTFDKILKHTYTHFMKTKNSKQNWKIHDKMRGSIFCINTQVKS